jgi:D-glycero-D-manno-heptose 1,7-bisphosphate phosphatase
MCMNKAFFLDRDGVINYNAPEHDYIKNWGDFKLLPNVIEAIKLIKDLNYLTIVISNQRGIARGLMTTEDVQQIHNNLNKELKENDTNIDAFYFCSHDYIDNCNCRKPKTGMVLRAVKDFNIDVSSCWLIGDSDTDIELANIVKIKSRKISKNGSLFDAVKSIFENKQNV